MPLIAIRNDSAEMIPPFAQCGEYGEFAGIFQAPLLQCADDSGPGAAQEGVGGFFQCDGGGQGGQVRIAQALGIGDAVLHVGVVRLAGQCEAQVGGGVFVCAIHAGRFRELCQALKGA